MSIFHVFKLFAFSYPLLIAVDMLWLGIIMRSTYQAHLGHLMRIWQGTLHIYWPAALAVWALMVLGSILLVVPRTAGVTFLGSFAWGAFYGLVLYGVYDLTNYAIIAQWPFAITLIDIAWGMCLNGMLAVFLKWNAY